MKNREKGEKRMQKFLRRLERFSQSLLSPLSYLSAAGLLLAAVWLVFPGLFRRLPRWLRRTVCVVLVAGLLALGTILTLMGDPN